MGLHSPGGPARYRPPKPLVKTFVEVHKKALVIVRLASLETKQEKKDLLRDITTVFAYVLSIYQEVKDNIRNAKKQRSAKLS